MKLVSLKKRQEFIDIAKKGDSVATKGLVLQVLPFSNENESIINIGFTATKKIGNAVKRNKVKRKLRSLAREIISEKADSKYKYVLIGRYSTTSRKLSDLEKDLKYALHKTGTYLKK